MRMRKQRRGWALLLAGVLLLSCASCNPATPASSGEPEVSEPVPVGQRDKVVSLNGQWDLYVDTIEKVTVAKNKVSAGSQRVALNGSDGQGAAGVRLL